MKELTEAMALRRESARLIRMAVDLEIRARAKENAARVKRERRDGGVKPPALISEAQS